GALVAVGAGVIICWLGAFRIRGWWMAVWLGLGMGVLLLVGFPAAAAVGLAGLAGAVVWQVMRRQVNPLWRAYSLANRGPGVVAGGISGGSGGGIGGTGGRVGVAGDEPEVHALVAGDQLAQPVAAHRGAAGGGGGDDFAVVAGAVECGRGAIDRAADARDQHGGFVRARADHVLDDGGGDRGGAAAAGDWRGNVRAELPRVAGAFGGGRRHRDDGLQPAVAEDVAGDGDAQRLLRDRSGPGLGGLGFVPGTGGCTVGWIGWGGAGRLLVRGEAVPCAVGDFGWFPCGDGDEFPAAGTGADDDFFCAGGVCVGVVGERGKQGKQ